MTRAETPLSTSGVAEVNVLPPAMENPQMTRDQAVDAIFASRGRFFGCTFITRGTPEKPGGRIRVMWCRFAEVGDLKGTGRKTTRDLIVVWDDAKKDWRSIPTEGLIELRIDGEVHKIEPSPVPAALPL